MLRASNECSDAGWKRIVENTRLVAFLATPHSGAALGAVVKFFNGEIGGGNAFVHGNQNLCDASAREKRGRWSTVRGATLAATSAVPRAG